MTDERQPCLSEPFAKVMWGQLVDNLTCPHEILVSSGKCLKIGQLRDESAYEHSTLYFQPPNT